MSDKTVVVTGGAGPNLGTSISTHMADEGADVAILDIDTTAGDDLVKTITSRGGEASFIETDLMQVDSIRSAMESVLDTYGNINILINSAGTAFGTTLESITEEEFDQNIRLNLKSGFFCTQAALPYLKATSGSVVYISSINAVFGGFSEVGYASAKSGLHALCRGLTADYSEYGIRFNVVCAGSIMGKSTVWQEREQTNPDILNKIANIYPLNRSGKPKDIARAVLFLASDEADWITGVVLPVDGGLTATGNLPGGQWWEDL